MPTTVCVPVERYLVVESEQQPLLRLTEDRANREILSGICRKDAKQRVRRPPRSGGIGGNRPGKELDRDPFLFFPACCVLDWWLSGLHCAPPFRDNGIGIGERIRIALLAGRYGLSFMPIKLGVEF